MEQKAQYIWRQGLRLDTNVMRLFRHKDMISQLGLLRSRSVAICQGDLKTYEISDMLGFDELSNLTKFLNGMREFHHQNLKHH